MANAALNILEGLAGVALEPVPIKVLGSYTELDNEVSGQVLWFQLASLLPPEAQQGSLILAHDDPGI